MRKRFAGFFCLLPVALMLNGCATPSPTAGPYSATPASTGRDTEKRMYVNADALHLRSCPGVQCRIIRVLKQGERGVVVRESSGWTEIAISGPNPATGWVATSYLSSRPVAEKKRSSKRVKKDPSPPPLPAEELAPAEPDTDRSQGATPKEEFAQ